MDGQELPWVDRISRLDFCCTRHKDLGPSGHALPNHLDSGLSKASAVKTERVILGRGIRAHRHRQLHAQNSRRSAEVL